MTAPEDPVRRFDFSDETKPQQINITSVIQDGLTTLDRVALTLLQGMLADSQYNHEVVDNPRSAAKEAYRYADAFLIEKARRERRSQKKNKNQAKPQKKTLEIVK